MTNKFNARQLKTIRYPQLKIERFNPRGIIHIRFIYQFVNRKMYSFR